MILTTDIGQAKEEEIIESSVCHNGIKELPPCHAWVDDSLKFLAGQMYNDDTACQGWVFDALDKIQTHAH